MLFNEFKNLKVGLKTLNSRCENLENKTLDYLLGLYGNLAILINEAMKGDPETNLIAYDAQDLQVQVYEELKRRIEK